MYFLAGFLVESFNDQSVVSDANSILHMFSCSSFIYDLLSTRHTKKIFENKKLFIVFN